MKFKNINSVGKLRAMFCLIAARTYCIKHFMMDSPDRFLEASRSKLDYPVLLLEKPTKTPTEDGFWKWDGAFVVLQYADLKTQGYEAEDDAYTFTEVIADNIIGLLTKGIDLGKGQHEDFCSVPIEFGTMQMVCDLYCGFGWRVPFSFRSTRKLCASACNIAPDPCPRLCPEFCFKTDKDLNVCLENKSLNFDSIEWTIKRPGQKPKTYTEEKIILNSKDFFDSGEGCQAPIEVILKACSTAPDGSQCCKYARYVLQPCISEGCSDWWHPIDCTEGDVSLNPGGQ